MSPERCDDHVSGELIKSELKRLSKAYGSIEIKLDDIQVAIAVLKIKTVQTIWANRIIIGFFLTSNIAVIYKFLTM